MRASVTRTVLAAAAAVPLCFLAAAPAGAAPQPATLDATGDATQIALQFTLRSSAYENVFCQYDVRPEGGGPLIASAATPLTFDAPPAPIIVGPTDPGTYAVMWGCFGDDGIVYEQIAGSPQGSPTLVTVGAPAGPGSGSAGSSNAGPMGLDRILAGLFGN
ncbi:hypothetical protein ACIGGF_07840 [Rhodococcus sp. NPDC078407]|uniref:hypothetical protein n=1 Tax=Rhodococcus sp. NPDC078407 TaxID=3364509 RepID=UPI0037C98EE6